MAPGWPIIPVPRWCVCGSAIAPHHEWCQS